MPLISRQAERLQRALEGERVTDADIRTLLESARSLAGVSTPGLAPRPEFVQGLRERLMAEAATLPAPSPAAPGAPAARRAASRSPVVLVVGRGLPRMVAGAAASALAVAAVVGVASRSALPGTALYPVKGWLDSIAVQLAESDHDRGLTRLEQAQEHISDARTLADADPPDAENLIEAIHAATHSVRRGQRDLNTAYDRTGNPQSLLAVRDFSVRALPQVEAMRPDVPAAALPALRELESLIGDAAAAAARRIAACGSPCTGSLAQSATASDPASLPALPSLAIPPTTAPGGRATVAPTTSRAIVTVPGQTVPGPAGGGSTPAPGVTVGGDGVVLGGAGGGATVTSGGAGVSLPSVSVTVPSVPSASLTVGIPPASAGTSSVGVTVPGQTIGGLTLPGVTASLP